MLSYFYVIIIKGLQFRGHAMFSELDRPLGGDTIEYAWLMELSCGNLCGKVSSLFFRDFFHNKFPLVLNWWHENCGSIGIPPTRDSSH